MYLSLPLGDAKEISFGWAKNRLWCHCNSYKFEGDASNSGSGEKAALLYNSFDGTLLVTSLAC